MKIVSRKEAKAAGARHYFTGKPCPYGHNGFRFVSTFGCVECTKLHHTRYRQDDKFAEREAAYKAEYRRANREKINAYAAEKWRSDPHSRESNRKSKERNRDKINQRQRVANMTAEQIEKQKAHRQRMYVKFRDDRLHRAKVGTAIRRGADGKHAKADIAMIMSEQGGKCPGCFADITKEHHLDHIIPISRGGSNWPENIQILCPRCNMSKHKLTLLEWFERDQLYFVARGAQ